MSLESWTEQMLDSSFFARAVRKSTAKSVVLGWLDAMQNPNAVLSEMAGANTSGAPPADKTPASALPGSAQPVALPRPTLLAIPSSDTADEPDRPGVPPKKVRKQKKQATPKVETLVPVPPTPPSEASS